MVDVRDGPAGPVLVRVPAARVDPAALRLYLGGAGEGGRWAVVAEPGAPAVPGARPAGLLEVAADLHAHEAAELTTAVMLARWHATHGRCPRCGTATQVEQGGWARRCPQDGSVHFPRTDPAVIMLPTRGEQCLVARQGAWPPGRFSCLAGFVEPGESLEQAVVREVAEEVGLRVLSGSYVASQPWPPASLMLAFEAVVAPGDVGPGDGEIAETRWYDRDGLLRAATGGEVRLPPPVSVAHLLLSRWVGVALPARW